MYDKALLQCPLFNKEPTRKHNVYSLSICQESAIQLMNAVHSDSDALSAVGSGVYVDHHVKVMRMSE